MKKFTFSLDKILDYKNQIKDSRQNEFMEAQAAVRSQIEKIEDLKEQYGNCSRELNEKQRAGTDIRTVFTYDNYLEILGHQIKEAERMLRVLEKERDIKKQRLLEARKESMTIDKLKEHKREEYNHELQKESEKEIEEFVSNARVRIITEGFCQAHI